MLLKEAPYDYEYQEPCIELPRLDSLRLHLDTTPGIAKQFLDALKCKNLQSLDISNEGDTDVVPAYNLIKRSECALREIKIESLCPSYGTAYEEDLSKLILSQAKTLEVLHLHTLLMEFDWFGSLTAPNLRELDFLCFGLDETHWSRFGPRKDYNKDPDAEDLALRLLRWVQMWSIEDGAPGSKKSNPRKSQLTTRFCASASTMTSRDFYRPGREYYRPTSVALPQEVHDLKDELVGSGMKVEIEWWVHNWAAAGYEAQRLEAMKSQ
ncbi:hypothetical protein DFP72DRAFT_921233, partial [Ephemerocybe angulata]